MTNKHLTSLIRSLQKAAPPPGARERVRARLFERDRRHAQPWLWLAAGMGATAALALVMFSPRRPAPDPARVLQLAGQVAMITGDKRSGGVARTELDGQAWIETTQGQVLAGAIGDFLVLGMEDTRFRIERQGRDVVVHLDKGQIHLWSAPRTSGTLSVATPHHRAAVIGTIFSVRFAGGELISVARGTVDVYAEDLLVARLSAGQSWASGLEPSAVSARTLALLERAARGETIELWPAPALAPSIAPAIPEAPRPVASDAKPNLLRPKARRVATARRVDAAEEPAAAPTTPPARPESQADRLAREAESLEQEGDFRAAAARYEEMARGTGLDAEWALYRLGKLRERHLGDREGALRAWGEHRIRFPSGSLRQEADLSVVETLVRLGRNDQALVEAERFLSRYPQSERRAEVETLRRRLKP